DTLASGNHKPPNETRCASFPTRKCGGVGEWLNPSDCKSDRLAYTGSNPVPSTTGLPQGGQTPGKPGFLQNRCGTVCGTVSASWPRRCWHDSAYTGADPRH